MNTFSQQIKIVILAIILGLGVTYAFAWTGPTQSPPNNGAIDPPVNTGISLQVKKGKLVLNSLRTDQIGLEVYGNSIFHGNGSLQIGVDPASGVAEELGTFKLRDGTQGPGKLLMSDANGNAHWEDQSVGVRCTLGSGLFMATGPNGTAYTDALQFLCKNGKLYAIVKGTMNGDVNTLSNIKPSTITNTSFPSKVACNWSGSTFSLAGNGVTQLRISCDANGYVTGIYPATGATPTLAGNVACYFTQSAEVVFPGNGTTGGNDDLMIYCSGNALLGVGVNTGGVYPW